MVRLDITFTMFSSFIMLLIFWCYGKGYAFMSFAVTGLLGILLMPQSFAPWMFLGLFGYYPTLKSALDKLPKIIRYFLKAVLITAVLALYLAAFYLLTMQGNGTIADLLAKCFGEPGDPAWMGWIIVGLTYFIFFCYDLLIDRLVVIYHFKWKARMEKWMK